MADQESRRILVLEGLIEDVHKTTHNFTEEQCRGLLAAVETMLKTDPQYRDYADLKVTKSSVAGEVVWLLG